MATSVLDAATREFAAHGPAAASLERIAEQAGVDVGTVLREFGSVDALFDRVFAESTSALVRAVHLDAGDLPRFAGDVFDAIRRDGTLVRLSMWQALERSGEDGDESGLVAGWLDAIADANGGSVELDSFEAPEILAYALALAKAELIAPRLLASRIAAADPVERRAHVEEAMRRVVGHHA